jgi:hypothetical protein
LVLAAVALEGLLLETTVLVVAVVAVRGIPLLQIKPFQGLLLTQLVLLVLLVLLVVTVVLVELRLGTLVRLLLVAVVAVKQPQLLLQLVALRALGQHLTAEPAVLAQHLLPHLLAMVVVVVGVLVGLMVLALLAVLVLGRQQQQQVAAAVVMAAVLQAGMHLPVLAGRVVTTLVEQAAEQVIPRVHLAVALVALTVQPVQLAVVALIFPTQLVVEVEVEVLAEQAQ